MIGAGSFRILALGALCFIGVTETAAASSARHQAHAHSTAAVVPASFRGGHSAVYAGGFREERRGSSQRIVLERGSPRLFEHGRLSFGAGSWAKSRNWVRTGRGGRFTTRTNETVGEDYARSGHSGGGIQCVTFARADSGIELEGNANTWWDHAAGLYQRGNAPEAGAVLNFRANGAMRMGHVAVVNTIINSRTVEVDHANWGGPGAVRGGVSRAISVVDVSPANDWTAVRVGLGHSGEYGSIYPTYGFIYNRPDRGVMVAANQTNAAVPPMNPAPRDLRGYGRDPVEEVAEAPEGDAHSYTYASYHFSRVARHRHLVAYHRGVDRAPRRYRH